MIKLPARGMQTRSAGFSRRAPDVKGRDLISVSAWATELACFNSL